MAALPSSLPWQVSEAEVRVDVENRIMLALRWALCNGHKSELGFHTGKSHCMDLKRSW